MKLRVTLNFWFYDFYLPSAFTLGSLHSQQSLHHLLKLKTISKTLSLYFKKDILNKKKERKKMNL